MINKNDLFKFLKIALPVIVIILMFFIFINLFKDNDKPFLESGWVTIDDPKFYHYFYKNDTGYTIKTYDKYHDLISINKNGILDGNSLIFDDVDDSKDIYTYGKDKIDVFDISKRDVKTRLFPLERIDDE